MHVIFEKARGVFWRLLGINSINYELNKAKITIAQLQEEVATLQYFLNILHDCKEIQPASDPNLRIMQECDVVLLQIFDKICQKHNLVYWLDWGTLLGAVRHGGFIPWDDDMDVGMPRSDYEKLLVILRSEFADSAFEIDKEIYNPEEEFCCTRIGIGYKHLQTGIWLDVFPMDFVFADNVDRRTWTKSSAFYRQEGGWGVDCVLDGGSKRFVYCPGSYNMIPCSVDEVFPLSVTTFEGVGFPAPKHLEEYVTHLYRDPMKFPKSGVEHHDQGRGALKDWASRSGVDMNKIKLELQEYLSRK